MDSPSSEIQLIEQLADEFAERQERGEQPTLEEYVDRHPELATEIREVFPALVMMERAAPATSDLKESRQPAHSFGHIPLRELGDYRILREIGRGGMGVVYEAEQQSLGRRVALKVLPRDFSTGGKSMERFQREARAAARMHHTNIVPVFEVGHDGDTAFYAMQLIQGQGLDLVVDDLKRLRREHSSRTDENLPGQPSSDVPASIAASLVSGRFHQEDLAAEVEADPVNLDQAPNPVVAETVDHTLGSTVSAALPGDSEISTAETNRNRFYCSVAHIGMQTADALAYAHARGIIHRDIKPSNLILDSGGVVWVTDFGLAKTDDEAMTHTGDILGTMRYMSPERFRGQCDVRADVYSLGLTLYELLVLKPVFESPDRLKLIEMVCQSEPPTLRRIDSRIPRDLETIVLKSIDKDPKRRYQSADELSEDLRRFVNDEPITARRISLPERLIRWSRRNRGVAASLTAIMVLLIAAAVGSSVAANYFRDLANWNKDLQVQAQQLASKETVSRQEAEAAREEIRRQLYRAEMNVAVREWNEGYVDRVIASLKRHQPEKGKDDLRGFEWYHLWQLCRRALESPVLEPRHPVGCIAYSPTQNKLVSAGSRWVTVWDLESREQDRVFKSAKQWVLDVAFSPDGSRLATANDDNNVKVWDLESKSLLHTLDHDMGVWSVEFSPDGQLLASGSRRGGVVVLWDATTGKELDTLVSSSSTVPINTNTTLSFSSDGQLLAVGKMRDGGGVMLYNVQKRKELEELLVGGVLAVDFSSDDTIVTAKLTSNEVVLWDLKNGRAHQRLVIDAAPRRSTRGIVAFSPSSNVFAVNGPAKRIELRDSTTGAKLDSIAGSSGPVAFSPTGKQLAFCSDDGVVRLWNLTTTSSPTAIRAHASSTTSLAFSPDGNLLLSAGGSRQLKLWDTRTWGLHKVIDDQVSRYGATLSPDGNLLAYVSYLPDGNKVVRLWDVRTQRVRDPVTDADRFTHSMAFAPDSRYLAIAGDKDIKLWDVSGQEKPQTLRGHDALVECVVFSPDGKTLASGSYDFTVMLWDVATGRPLHKLGGHTRRVGGVVFSPDGKSLISGSGDGTMRLWDVVTGKEVSVLSKNMGSIKGLALSSDETTLAIAVDRSVALWDLSEQKERVQIRCQSGISLVAFSPDGRTLAAGHGDGHITVLRAADPEDVRRAGW